MNDVLQRLTLNQIELGDEGAKLLAEGLENNTGLVQLSIRQNKIGQYHFISPEPYLQNCK
jgi:hypothetical protein